MEFAMRFVGCLLSLFALLSPLSAQNTLNLTLQPFDRIQTTASVTLVGSVAPADALLLLDGNPVALDGSGAFSHNLTLLEGMNTLLFRVAHADHGARTFKHTLVFDQTAPTLVIDSPGLPHYTNQTALTVIGRVGDNINDPLTLTRDGKPVPLQQFQFFDQNLALSDGLNQVTYQLSDSSGNTTNLTIDIYHRATPPAVTLTLPERTAAFGSFTLAVTPTLAEDLVSQTLTLDGTPVFSAQDGAPFSQSFSHSGDRDAFQVRYSARDRYGNNLEENRTITVDFPVYVYGQVLDDTTSYPLPGIAVQLSAPAGGGSVVTDSAGRFEAYLTGTPIDLTINAPDYVPLARHFTVTRSGGLRVHDVRLTPRAASQSLALPVNLAGVALNLSGFSGSVQATSFSDQALPAMLPTGWSPLRGFSLLGAQGQGRLVGNVQFASPLPADTPLVVLYQQASAWRVVQSRAATGSRLDLDLADSSAGNWLIAAPDAGVALPAVGDLLARTNPYPSPRGDLRDLTTDPEVVSPSQQAATTVKLTASGGFPSGSHAVVRVDEQTATFDGTETLPSYPLDIMLYRRPGVARAQSTLSFLMRTSISAQTTRTASTRFKALGGAPVSDNFSYSDTFTLERLRLEFGPQPGGTAPRAVQVLLGSESTPPLPPEAFLAATFHADFSATLTASPQLTFEQPDGGSLILLLNDDERWRPVAVLRHANGVWRNDPAQSDITRSGDYALVALPQALTELRGTVRFAGAAQADVWTQVQGLPWFGHTDSNGRYRLVAYQTDQSQTVDAFDLRTERRVSQTLAATAAALIDPYDLTLTQPEFTLLTLSPDTQPNIVPTWQIFRLNFNRPVPVDQNHWATKIRFRDATGTYTPTFTYNAGDFQIQVRSTSLQPDRDYTLEVDAGLQGAGAATLDQNYRFPFATRLTGPGETPLALDRFYLELQNGQITLVVPDNTYPHRTQLTLVNQNTAASWFETLQRGGRRLALTGSPGHVFALTVVTPDGVEHQRLLDSLVTGPNQVRLGLSQTRLDISDGAVLRLRANPAYVGRELRFTALDSAAARTRRDSVPALADLQSEPLSAFTIEIVDGGPPLDLSFDYEIRPTSEVPAGSLSLLNVVQDVEAPANPFEPEVTARFNIATVIGEIEPPPANDAAAEKNDLTAWIYYNVACPVQQGANAIMANFGVSNQYVHSLRESPPQSYTGDPANLSIISPDNPPTWFSGHNRSVWAGYDDPQPISSVAVYDVIRSDSLVSYTFRGTTDHRGFLKVPYSNYLAGGSLAGSDPFSLAVRNVTAVAIPHFDLIFPWIDAGQDPNQAKIKLRWEVIEREVGKDDAEIRVVASETDNLLNNNFFVRPKPPASVEDPTYERGLRLTAVSDKELESLTLDIQNFNPVTVDPITNAAADPFNLQIDWFDLQVATQLLVVRVIAKVKSDLNEDEQRFRRVIRIQNPTTITVNDPENPPMVLAARPYDRQQDVLPVETIHLRFTESVRGVSPTTVTLRDDTLPILLRFLDANLEEVDPSMLLTEIYLVPQSELRFASEHTIAVSNLVDVDNNPLIHFDENNEAKPGFTSTFKTADPQANDLNAGGTVQRAVAGMRNLTFHIVPTLNAERTSLTLLVDDSRFEQPIRLQEHAFTASSAHFPQIAVFDPDALKVGKGQEHNVLAHTLGRRPFRRIPQGTVVVVKFWSGFNKPHFVGLTYRNGAFETLFRLDVPNATVRGGLGSIGPYLLVGGFDLTDAGPVGSTDVVDMRDLIARIQTNLTNIPPGPAYKDAWEKADRTIYPYPRGVLNLTGFLRTDSQGRRLALAAAAGAFPAVTNLVDRGRAPVSPVAQYYDPEAVIATRWGDPAAGDNAPGRFGIGNYQAGAVEGYNYQRGTSLQTRDLALFLERDPAKPNDGSVVYLYELPAETDLQELSQPTFRFKIDHPVISMAVDRAYGLLALSYRDEKGPGVKVWSLKTLFHALNHHWASGDPLLPIDFNLTDQANQALVFWQTELDANSTVAPVGETLRFYQGRLYYSGRDGDIQHLSQINLMPSAYRFQGWMTYDPSYLFESDDADTREVADKAIDYLPYAVLYATDLPQLKANPQQSGFHVETGTWAIELFKDEKLEVTLSGPGFDHDLSTGVRRTRGMVGFNTIELTKHLLEPAHAAALREKGLLYFDLRYTITKFGNTVETEKTNFVVAYRQSPTHYEDGNRTSGIIDLLDGTPTLSTTDIPIPARDPRMDLSPTRIYRWDYALSVGDYGVGMFDGRRLFAAMPIWWRNLPADEKNFPKPEALPIVQFQVEHPGLWRLLGEVTPDRKHVALHGDAASTLAPSNGGWALNHRGNMVYQIAATRELPDLVSILRTLNNQANFSAESPEPGGKARERLLFPIVREIKTPEAPGSFYLALKETQREDKPWGNLMWPSGKTPRRHPSTIADDPEDGGERTATIKYKATEQGTLIESFKENGLEITYDYDEDAYLKEVTVLTHGSDRTRARRTLYSWQTLQTPDGNPMVLGKMPIKRLTKVERAQSDEKEALVTLMYADGATIAVQAVNYGLCDKALTLTRDKDSKKVTEAKLAGCSTFDETVTFGDVDGMWLSNSVSPGPGYSYAVTWARATLTHAFAPLPTPIFAWHVAEHGYGAGDIEYDAYNRPTKITQFKSAQTISYMTEHEWFYQPASVSEGNATVNYEWDDIGIFSATDPKSKNVINTWYSDSGVPYASVDPFGVLQGSGGTHHYLPRGGQATIDRAKATSRLTSQGNELSSATLNRYGETVGFQQLGEAGSMERDIFGRLTRTSFDNQDFLVSYEDTSIGGDFRTIAKFDDRADGSSWQERYDEYGLLREISTTKPTVSLTRFIYDPLGRLTSHVITEGNSTQRLTYAYHLDSNVVTKVDGPFAMSSSQTVETSNSGIIVKDSKNQIADQTDDVIRSTSADGLTQTSEQPNIGKVESNVDSFGLMVSAKAEKDGQTLTREFKADGIVTDNPFSGLHTATTFDNLEGTQRTIIMKERLAQSSPGRTVKNEISIENKKLIRETTVGDKVYRTTVNGKGWVEKVEAGNQVFTFSDFHATGAPGKVSVTNKTTSGETGATNTYDTYGRPTTGSDIHGKTWSVTYNDRGLIATTTNNRGLALNYTWHPEIDIVDEISTNAPNRIGQDKLILFKRANGPDALLTTQVTDWLGHQATISQSIAENDKKTTVTEFTSNPNNTANRMVTRTLTKQETTGLIDQSSGPAGTVNFNHESYGRKTETNFPNGRREKLEQDGFGDLARQTRDGLTQLKITRDARSRAKRLRTPDHEIRLDYDQEADAVSRIDGLKEPIAFSNFNHLSQPRRVDIGDGRVTLNLEYHVGGRLKCLTQNTRGGLTSYRNYSDLGDLTSLRRGNQAPIRYTYNVWGAVDTISYKGRDYSIFGAGGPQKLNLPGDVTANVDSKGRLVEIQRPGLSLKTMNFTDDDQLDQVLFDGKVLRDYDYQNGDLTQVRVFNPAGTEDLYTYRYDDYGRLYEIMENEQTLATWTYPDLSQPDPDPEKSWGHSDRMLTYTDGNGIVYTYSYDRYGHINGIELSGGPVFQMRFDATGLPLEIQSSGMRVQYDGWEQGLPAHITWGDGTHFTINRDSNNNLTRLANDNNTFVLDLTWQETPPGADPCEGNSNPPPKRLTRIIRQAADFNEILEPTYNDDDHLTGLRFDRNDNGNHYVIEEGYGQVAKQLLGGLTRVLNGSILVDETYQHDESADNRRISQRIGQAGSTSPAGTDQYQYDLTLGNLTQITSRNGNIRTFVWDGFRRLREIHDNGSLTASYQYDHRYRRIRAATNITQLSLAFAYQDSRVIAIGLYEGPGRVQWTHAIGQGPIGPAFIKDLTGAGHDYYIFCDHLGTPLAYKNAHTGTVYLNPRSPWGESLANAPMHSSPYTNQNFTHPPDPVFPSVPLGLSGHLDDYDTGLTYMHHRYYDPRSGHFLNPDFRAPDIYEPSTFTEPYAYAAGNPMIFWDPNGLAFEYRYFTIKNTHNGEKQVIRATFEEYKKATEGKVFEFERSTNHWLNIVNFGWDKGKAQVLSWEGELPFTQRFAQAIGGPDAVSISSSAPVETGGLPYYKVDINFGAQRKFGPIIVGYENVTLHRFDGRTYYPLESVSMDYAYIGFGPEVKLGNGLKKLNRDLLKTQLTFYQAIQKFIRTYQRIARSSRKGHILKTRLNKQIQNEVLATTIYKGEGWYSNTTYPADDPNYLENYRWNGRTVSIQPFQIWEDIKASKGDMRKFAKKFKMGPGKASANMTRTTYIPLTNLKLLTEGQRELADSYSGKFWSIGGSYGPAGMDYFGSPPEILRRTVSGRAGTVLDQLGEKLTKAIQEPYPEEP